MHLESKHFTLNSPPPHRDLILVFYLIRLVDRFYSELICSSSNIVYQCYVYKCRAGGLCASTNNITAILIARERNCRNGNQDIRRRRQLDKVISINSAKSILRIADTCLLVFDIKLFVRFGRENNLTKKIFKRLSKSLWAQLKI